MKWKTSSCKIDRTLSQLLVDLVESVGEVYRAGGRVVEGSTHCKVHVEEGAQVGLVAVRQIPLCWKIHRFWITPCAVNIIW